MSLLNEAEKKLKEAREKFKSYLKIRDPFILGHAMDSSWLCVDLAIEHLLVCAGAERTKGGLERNKLLEELEKHVAEVRELAMTERMRARANTLIYTPIISPKLQSLGTELDEVEKYLKDVKKIAGAISRKRGKLEPILREVQRKWRGRTPPTVIV